MKWERELNLERGNEVDCAGRCWAAGVVIIVGEGGRIREFSWDIDSNGYRILPGRSDVGISGQTRVKTEHKTYLVSNSH